ncbi:hypothetical protein A8924_0618 [Saccharopolyspora erythraea NRRL 2338]|uniref:Uncharacterized protein n=3 Tax=Saccharopolyspora erythraea TaxID=1836 RepID=A4F6A4_SACEN|nr:hypothetical protein N599_01155 [Saccharopolyspora erythraea D]PFG93380.1 hypothetical protein A8924_0618 [Saccharopolyspora erythraea NRRL 2338]QRK90215.1 hypothetical protein JQX30_01145 [Saccharopolyspora erythraea]CAL99578.1 hypothetical protein SACE_0226 [Saccharopolyspora erythraea NRRL 2338]
MRSLSRAVIVGAMTVPLALGFAGFAAAHGDSAVCNVKACNNHDWTWDWFSVENTETPTMNIANIS